MICQPEYDEDVSFRLICETNIKKGRPSTYGIVFVCISSCSVDYKIAHCCFLLVK